MWFQSNVCATVVSLSFMYCFKVNDRVVPVYVCLANMDNSKEVISACGIFFPNRMQGEGLNVIEK